MIKILLKICDDIKIWNYRYKEIMIKNKQKLNHENQNMHGFLLMKYKIKIH